MAQGTVVDREAAAPQVCAPSMWGRVRRICTGAFIVGIVATIADWATLWGLVWFGEKSGWDLVKNWAVVPGCLVGLLIQFFGNRHFSFGVRGEVAREFLVRQIWRFAVVEGCSLLLISATYNFCIEVVGIDFRIARAIVGLVIYWGFSLPLWNWVFSTRK